MPSKTTGEVTSKTTNKYTVFTVVNYEMYQCDDKQIDKQQTIKGHSNDILTTTIEEYKEEKEIKNKNNVQCAIALFELLWKDYPCKKGKGQVSQTQKDKLYKIGYEEMCRAIVRYNADLDRDKEWRKHQNGSTFFNSGYVDYLDANYVPDKKSSHQPNIAAKRFNQFPQNHYNFEELEKELSVN